MHFFGSAELSLQEMKFHQMLSGFTVSVSRLRSQSGLKNSSWLNNDGFMVYVCF